MNKVCFSSKTFGPSRLYSTAVQAGGLAFISGMGPTDPATGKVEKGGFGAQIHRVLQNLGIVLKELGLSYSDVVKTNIYLSDMENFAQANEVYTQYFTQDLPARTTVQVARLPGDIAVEIELVAALRRAEGDGI